MLLCSTANPSCGYSIECMSNICMPNLSNFAEQNVNITMQHISHDNNKYPHKRSRSNTVLNTYLLSKCSDRICTCLIAHVQLYASCVSMCVKIRELHVLMCLLYTLYLAGTNEHADFKENVLVM